MIYPAVPTVWLTGANGQIGRHIAHLLAPHVRLIATTRHDTDIANRAAVWRTAAAVSPHIIINAAAFTRVDEAEHQPEAAFAANAQGAAHLAQAAHALGAVLIHLSTDYVFDGNQNRPYREYDPPAPLNRYGSSKLAGEQLIARYCSRHLIIRTAWVFDHHSGFVHAILTQARQHQHLNVIADRFGSPTYAGDVAAAVCRIAQRALSAPESLPYGVYHYAGATHTSWFGLAQSLCQAALRQRLLTRLPQIHPIAAADYPSPATRPVQSRLNSDKITRTFGIPPCDWQHALARCLANSTDTPSCFNTQDNT